MVKHEHTAPPAQRAHHVIGRLPLHLQRLRIRDGDIPRPEHGRARLRSREAIQPRAAFHKRDPDRSGLFANGEFRADIRHLVIAGSDDERVRAVVNNLEKRLTLVEPDAPLPLRIGDAKRCVRVQLDDGAIRQGHRFVPPDRGGKRPHDGRFQERPHANPHQHDHRQPRHGATEDGAQSVARNKRLPTGRAQRGKALCAIPRGLEAQKFDGMGRRLRKPGFEPGLFLRAPLLR